MTEETIQLQLDGETITVPRGATLLDAAQAAGIDIPVICYHEATTPNGLCRICVVDVDGGRVLQPACVAECQADTQVETRNERVLRSRRTILEMLNASVNLEQAPEIQQMMADYEADDARFPDAQLREAEVIDDNPFYVRDYEQCVLCWRCVQVCAEDAQFTFALTLKNRGHDTSVATAFDISMTESPCVFCGQCVGVCPTGALKPKVEWGMEQGWGAEEMRNATRRSRKRKDGARRWRLLSRLRTHPAGALPATYQLIEGEDRRQVEGGVIDEGLLSIYVNGESLATMMCSPLQLEALTVGFLYNEGVIDSADEIALLQLNQTQSVADVILTRDEVALPRRMILTTGCGGGVTGQVLSESYPALVSDFQTRPAVILRLMRQLQGAARLVQCRARRAYGRAWG